MKKQQNEELKLIVSTFSVFFIMLLQKGYRVQLIALTDADLLSKAQFCVKSAMIVMMLGLPVYILITVISTVINICRYINRNR